MKIFGLSSLLFKANIQGYSLTNSECFLFRSSPPDVLLGKVVLKKCSKFTEEHPCRSTISIKLLYRRTPMPKCDFNKVAKRCSLVNLLHIFRTPFPRNNPGGLLKSVDEFYLIIYVGGFFFLVNL